METVEEKRICKGPCGLEHKLSFFSINKQTFGRKGKPKIYYKSICKGCEEKQRLEIRPKHIKERPFHRKAYKTIYQHAKAIGMDIKQFEDHTGVTVNYIEGLFREAQILQELAEKGLYKEPIGHCHSCKKAFKHKRAWDDFTLDRRDRTRPFTRSNIWIICGECNSSKGDKDSTQFDVDNMNWDYYNTKLKEGIQFTISNKPLEIAVT